MRNIRGVILIDLFFAGILAGLLFLGSGCSKYIKKTESHGKWTCDREADDALNKGDYDRAILLHRNFLEKEPENGLALYHIGYAYGQKGNLLKEVFYYNKAIECGFKEQGIFFNLGMAYGGLNRTEESIRVLKKGVEIEPNNAENHFGLGIIYQRVIKDHLAEREFLNALDIDPDHLDARFRLALLYADMGKLQKACEQLREILRIDPGNRWARDFLERIRGE